MFKSRLIFQSFFLVAGVFLIVISILVIYELLTFSPRYTVSNIELKSRSFINTSIIELSSVPAFELFNSSFSETITPDKDSIGKNNFALSYDKNNLLIYESFLPKVNSEDIFIEINEYLGEDSIHFGIYIYDLRRNQEISQNEDLEYPPGSISKLPSVILTLKDIDEGKISFDDTLPVKNELKHTDWDVIGSNYDGTELPFRTYIDAAILESNNSAHYHLHDYLGGAGIVNSRTNTELNAAKFFLDPHTATARSIGNVLIGLYKETILSHENSNYLLNLMKNTYEDLRLAIPGGVPENIEVANKVGFLYGGIEGSTYSDAAIVYGEKTDYVVVILNNEAPDFPFGYIMIREISRIVYEELN